MNHLSRHGFRRVPHPRSPAARTFDWSPLSFPHPDSPAARYVDWGSGILPHPDSPSGRGYLWDRERSGIDDSAGEELTQIRRAAELSLDRHSDALRDTLPDIALQIIYDREISLIKEAYSFTRSFTITDPAQILLKVQRQIGWVHCHLQAALTQSYQIAVGPILDQLDSLQTQTRSEEKGKLLRNIQSLAERYYTAATESIQEHLADVTKTGKQPELIHKWRARMLACASAGAAAIEAPPEPLAPARKPPKKSDSSDTPVKTWIAFQLIDEDGDPVPNIAYRVTLTDGSVMTGSLDDQGTTRFDDIDPGECTVSFPEIHAREWKPA
jgi:hypothetical protein